MKLFGRLAVSALGAAALVIPAMSAAQAAPDVTVVKSIPESGSQTVKVPGGNSVRFRIPSNATTGYSYTVTTLKNTAESAVSKSRYVEPTNPIPGKGGNIVVLVVPEHSGTTVIKFTNVAPSGAVAGTSQVRLLFMN